MTLEQIDRIAALLRRGDDGQRLQALALLEGALDDLPPKAVAAVVAIVTRLTEHLSLQPDLLRTQPGPWTAAVLFDAHCTADFIEGDILDEGLQEVEYDNLSFDYYDESIEIYGWTDALEPGEDIRDWLFSLGFRRIFVNSPSRVEPDGSITRGATLWTYFRRNNLPTPA